MNTVFDNTSVMWTKVNSVVAYAASNCSLLTAYTAAKLTKISTYAGSNSMWRRHHANEFLYVLRQILNGKTI